MILAALLNGKSLWYLTRGTGVVALLLLTGSIALGVLTAVRWRSPRWPRFALGGLHRNLTLLAIAFVVAHVGTTVLDGYAPVRLQDAVIPFVSRYRPIWLGLGAVAFDLLLALVITSLLRARIGYRLWRGIHWLAYAAWPVALVHALGTGSDARSRLMIVVGIASIATIALAVIARAALGGGGPPHMRVTGPAAALLSCVGIGVWYSAGPAQQGWARRAGTPSTLLASSRAARSAGRPTPVTARLPETAFSARLRGRLEQSTLANGLVSVVITGRLVGGPAGAVRIDLRGAPLQGGVTMSASGVSYAPAGTRTVYTGSVTSLAGSQIAASVATPSGARLRLAFGLSIDAGAGTVSGTVDGIPARSE